MSFQWEAYLELAQQLAPAPAAPPGPAAPPDPPAPPDPSEAALRTAVSRAYYSAYHLARAYVERNNLASVGRQDSHKAVWDALGRSGGPPRPRQERAIKSKGFTLRDARNDADYEGDRPDSTPPPTPEARLRYWKGQAALAVEHAKSIRDLLAQIGR